MLGLGVRILKDRDTRWMQSDREAVSSHESGKIHFKKGNDLALKKRRQRETRQDKTKTRQDKRQDTTKGKTRQDKTIYHCIPLD